MLIKASPTFRTRRPRRVKPVPLTLVSAVWQSTSPQWVRLTFDRPVSIASIDVTAVIVENQPGSTVYRGLGAASLFSANTVQVNLSAFTMTSGSQVLLTATGASGIAASSDGGTWPGVTKLALPF